MRKFPLIIIHFIFFISYPATGLRSEVKVTWHDCIIMAKKNNPELVSAREKINQLRAGEGITRSVMLPQIGADLGKTVSEGKSGKKIDTYSYGISGKQLIFDGLNSYYSLKEAGKKTDVSLYEYIVVESNLRLNLRNAFVQLLKAQESLKIKKEIVERRRQNVDLVKLRYDAGREHIGSLLTAEADLAQAQFELSQSQRYIIIFQRLLAKEIGIKEFVHFKADGNFNIIEPASGKPDLDRLVKGNPLLRQMIALRESAEYSLKSSRSEFSPKVYGSAGAGKTGQEWPPANKEWSLGIDMTLSLFEGGKQFYGMKKAEAELKQAEADMRSVSDRVIFTLEQKWAQFLNGKDYVDVQMKFIKAAEERSKIASAQYSVGLISFDNWVIIEDTLVRAMNNIIEARANALLAEAEWIQAKGETLEYDK